MQSVPLFALPASFCTYTSRIPGWGGTPGSGWWFPGLCCAACRKPLGPPTQTPPPALYEDDTLLPFKPLCYLLTTHTSWLPRWRRPPRSGMVVCRPLRSSLPETPGTPQCRPCLSKQNTQLFFEFLCFPQHLHFPDSGTGRYSRVWNGGF